MIIAFSKFATGPSFDGAMVVDKYYQPPTTTEGEYYSITLDAPIVSKVGQEERYVLLLQTADYQQVEWNVSKSDYQSYVIGDSLNFQ